MSITGLDSVPDSGLYPLGNLKRVDLFDRTVSVGPSVGHRLRGL